MTKLLPLGWARRRALRAFVANRDANLFFGVHATWESAVAQAANFGRAGYDNPDSAELYRHRLRIDSHDYPALYWLSRSFQDGLQSVFDVGGSIGIKFYAFKDLLASYPAVSWLVEDVPAAVTLGQQLAVSNKVAERLRFTAEFFDGDGCDLLYASGALQYLPQTLPDILRGYRRLPRRILLNTTAIHPKLEFFTVNSIGTAFCPYRVQTQASLVRGLGEFNYRLRDSWINPGKTLRIPFLAEYEIGDYSGLCFDLR